MALYPVLLVCSLCALGQDWWFVRRASDHLTSTTKQTPTITITTHLQLSNQPVLICYKRGPSGPYYSNPCDVIPKQQCILSSERHTILYLTTDRGISSLLLLFFLLIFFLLSLLCVSHPHKDKRWGRTVISLLDHFINNKPAGQSRCSYQRKQCMALRGGV